MGKKTQKLDDVTDGILARKFRGFFETNLVGRDERYVWEMRRAFYAGAAMLQKAIYEVSDEEAERLSESVDREFGQFAAAVKEGRA